MGQPRFSFKLGSCSGMARSNGRLEFHKYRRLLICCLKGKNRRGVGGLEGRECASSLSERCRVASRGIFRAGRHLEKGL